MPATDPWVVIDKMTFGYGDNLIFQDLSLALSRNLVALQGPSGSGKSTLLKLINHDLAADAGSIGHSGESAILILQDDGLIPWLSASDNLLISRSFNPANIANSHIAKSMDGFASKVSYQLSFGQRRFVEIVRALGSDADILLLDEPLNFLDSERRAIIIDELVRQARHRKILMSTHYIEDFGGMEVSRVQLQGTAPFREVVIR